MFFALFLVYTYMVYVFSLAIYYMISSLFVSLFVSLVAWATPYLQTDSAHQILGFVVDFSPILLVVALFLIFWPLWVMYVRAEFFVKEKYSTLQIRLPKETMKSPLAMELFLTALHQTGGEGTWYDKYWLGKTRPWFSLEMISIEGQVHFFIWTRTNFKNFIESSLYAQFPGIEIHEMDDYAKSVHFDPATTALWGCEFEFTNKNRAYPIKTYVDYGLDKDPKEEFKVDPLSPLLEFLGSVGANQQVWYQIIVRAHKKEHPKKGTLWDTTDKWKDEAMEEVNKILNRDPKTKVSGKVGEDGQGQRITVSPGEQDTVKALERSITKLAFDVNIRAVYVAKKDSFVGTTVPGIIGSVKQFNSEQLNGFKPNGKKWNPKFSYPWQDFKNIRQDEARKKILKLYKRRSFFFHPYPQPAHPLILNTEELATIFHFPGQVAATPTLARIPSKKGQAPANLPI